MKIKNMNKEELREYYKEKYYNKKKQIEKQLGNKCVVCGSDFHIHYHEIYGKKHERGSQSYVLNHIEDFAVLCIKCHYFIHYYVKLSTKANINKMKESIKILMDSNNKLQNKINRGDKNG